MISQVEISIVQYFGLQKKNNPGTQVTFLSASIILFVSYQILATYNVELR